MAFTSQCRVMSSHESKSRRLPKPIYSVVRSCGHTQSSCIKGRPARDNSRALRSMCANAVDRVCVLKGQLPRALMNHGQDPTHRQVLMDKIPPWMALKIRCQEVIAKCSQAVTENGLRSMSLDQERALDILLRTYEGQVDDLELQAVTGMLFRLFLWSSTILTVSCR